MTNSLALTKPLTEITPRTRDISSELPSSGSANATLRFIATRTSIDVKLFGGTQISALRFEIAFGNKFKYRTPDLGVRVKSLKNYINFQDNVLTFVLLDIDGKGIKLDEGTIISIPFDHDQNFEVTSAYASFGTSGITELDYAVSNDTIVDGETLTLEQNDPNPFSTTTKLEFRIADQASVKFIIYDVGGALIRTLLDSTLDAGAHRVEWDGMNDSGKVVEAGIYLYKLYAGINSVTRKMVFLK